MTDTRMTMLEAISRKRMVEAQYNGKTIRLAPHLMFERRGDLFISAYNPAKAIRADEGPKLGQFKLAGLNDAVLLDEEFEPLEAFRPEVPRDGDGMVLAV
jgi:hypothetical protein